MFIVLIIFVFLIVFISFLYMTDIRFRLMGRLVYEVSECKTLYIKDSVYVLTKDVWARGTCFRVIADNVTIDLNGRDIRGNSSGVGILVNGHNANVKNGKIKSFRYGIFLNASLKGKIINNSLDSNFETGLYINNASENIIKGNVIMKNSYYGIYIDSGKDNSISENNVSENFETGILLFSSYNNTVSGNSIDDNLWNGIYLYRSSSNLILYNIFNSNYWNAVSFASSYDNTVSGNSMRDSRGLHFYASSNNLIRDFLVINSTTGIYLSNSGSNLFRTGYVNSSDYGIYIMSFVYKESSDNSFQDMDIEAGLYDVYSVTVGSGSANLNNTFWNASYSSERIESFNNGGKTELIRRGYVDKDIRKNLTGTGLKERLFAFVPRLRELVNWPSKSGKQ